MNPGAKIDLDKLMEMGEAHIRNILLIVKMKQMIPTFAILKRGYELELVGTPWGSDKEKHLAQLMVRLMLKRDKAVAYSFLSEGWLSRVAQKDVGKPRVRPINDPNRIEVVTLTASHREGGRMLKSWEMIRNRKGELVDLKLIDEFDDQGEDRIAGDMPSLFD
jgi:hypothetical protein